MPPTTEIQTMTIDTERAVSKAGATKRHLVAVATDRPAWARQVGETRHAFLCFETFLNLGPGRTLQKTADALDRRLPGIRSMSQRHGWPARVKAWNESMAGDAELVMREHQRAALDKMRVRNDEISELAHAELLRHLQEEGTRSIRDLVPLVLGVNKDQRAVLGYADPTSGGGQRPGQQATVNVNVALGAADPRLQQFAEKISSWAADAQLSPAQLASLAAAISSV